jgi:hypothetical protein
VQVELDATTSKRFAAVMAEAPRLLQPFLLDGMKRVGLGLEAHVKSNQLGGQILKARTGTLRRAVFSRAEAVGEGDAQAVVGVDLGKAPYGRVQEMGGTITPRGGSALAIPIGEARTAKGVGRFTARDLLQRPQSFGYTGAFIAKNVIFGRRQHDVVPLFVLKPSVTLRPTGYLTRTVAEKRGWVIEELGRAVGTGLRKLFPRG